MTTSTHPDRIATERELDELLSRPTPEVLDLFQRLQGDIVIIGATGKIGPSLTAMAVRAREAAGGTQRVFAVARFSDPASADALASLGAEPIACDLLDPAAVARLPRAPNVLYLAGMKFGTAGEPDRTWAVNALAPARVAEHYRGTRIVAFSTGCVYPLIPVALGGSREGDALTPLGEYANSCVARERILQWCSRPSDEHQNDRTTGATLKPHAVRGLGVRGPDTPKRQTAPLEGGTPSEREREKPRTATPMVLLRLNYAVELRYGVLVDLATTIRAGESVDGTMGHVNVIWQGDVNAFSLRLLEHAACPPRPLNVTGVQTLRVRDLAEAIAQRMGLPVRFAGEEAPTALLADASRCAELLGEPPTPIERVLDWTAAWTAAGGPTLGKPTHFQTRDGRY